MAKTTQVMKIQNCGGVKYTAVFCHDTTTKPYRLYTHQWKRNEDGVLTERKYLVGKYDCLQDILTYMSLKPYI